MPEQSPSASGAAGGLQAGLHAIAEILRDPHPLSREIRDVLAELVDELGRSLAAGTVPPNEVAHLAETTAQLARAMHVQAAPGMLSAARSRLERAIVAAEDKAPLLAGLAHRLLDTLANIGI
jgi:hypothetical protein